MSRQEDAEKRFAALSPADFKPVLYRKKEMQPLKKSIGFWEDVQRRFKRSKRAVFSCWVLGFIVFICAAGPFIAISPNEEGSLKEKKPYTFFPLLVRHGRAGTRLVYPRVPRRQGFTFYCNSRYCNRYGYRAFVRRGFGLCRRENRRSYDAHNRNTFQRSVSNCCHPYLAYLR